MAGLRHANLTPLLDLLSLKGGDTSGTVGSIVGHVTAEPSLAPALCKMLAEKVSSAEKGTEAADIATNALKTYEALANRCIVLTEAYLAAEIPTMLLAASHKQANVRAAAEGAVMAFADKMSVNAVPFFLKDLFKASETGVAWQTRVIALKAMASLADHAPEQLGTNLPDVVPQVTHSMNEIKKEVSSAALHAMTAACEVIGNRDIEHMTKKIVRSITNPEETPEIMHDLAGVTFVQSVQSPALAMVVPLLIRGLRSRLTATRRQSCVIIDNMSKLVDEPLDAYPFLPTLMPALQFAADAMSDPEARNVAEKASDQLNRLNALCEETILYTKKADPALVLTALKAILPKGVNKDDITLNYIANLCCTLMTMGKFDAGEWTAEIAKYLANIMGSKDATTAVEALRLQCREMVKSIPPKTEDDDDSEELCNCKFTLAYGTKILLHNTVMRLKRGAKYGLLGGNDSGKTTLMRSIANGSVEGFPDPASVRTVFVEADILGELSHLSCVEYIMQDERLANLSKDEILAVMATVGFTENGKAKPFHAVSTLSGGWRMKLAMARAMLQKADILLLDEPTNHLDVINVAWVKSYIISLKNVTAIMVSHDSGFLNDCCTDMLQIERLKLKHHKGNLAHYLEMNPEARSFFDLKETKLKFKFPQPGPIEGVKSRSKALMKMSHCYFTYPGNTVPTLFDISVQVSMCSRVGCVGENGAGKSTMIKVLTGELMPQTGECWKHPNARVAYVAQHAFHHIESHLHQTPNEYIRWRYGNGEDKENIVKISMEVNEADKVLQSAPFEVIWKDDDGKICKANRVVLELVGSRRENKQVKEYEYEVKYKDGSEGYLTLKTLQKRGWKKAADAIDARIAQRSGQYTRTLSSANVEKHLADVGLEPEFATHYRMGALSGGQKVKVVLAAAMWNQPHILILDEPTNYLDRESLGALANAISAFEGGVVIISHNNEFVSTLCPEEWVMDAGNLTTKGEVGWMNRQDDKIGVGPQITEMTDALGNTSEVKQAKKVVSKRDEKALVKALRKKIATGEELDEAEEEMAEANELL